MRVLFIVPYVPNLIRVRPYQFIRHLAARGHQIVLLTVSTNPQERQELKHLSEICAEVNSVHNPAWRSLVNCVRALPTRDPLQASYSWTPALMEQVWRLAPAADVVHVEHLRGARYALALNAARGGRTPVIWDSVDCISDLFDQALQFRVGALGRAITRLELRRTRGYEAELISMFDRVLISSERDRRALLMLSRTGAPNVTVLRNGVDLEYFQPGREREAQTLVFSGKMSYHANESAVLHLIQDVMPRIWTCRPGVQLVVVGKNPSGRVRALAARHSSRVNVTGTVADIRPYLRRATVAVAPLVYGAGCQNKVLEAMATATPVVATPRAVSALEAVGGRDLLVADGPDAFAISVLELLASPARQRAIGASGRRYAEEHHRWDDIAGELETIYKEASESWESTAVVERAALV